MPCMGEILKLLIIDVYKLNQKREKEIKKKNALDIQPADIFNLSMTFLEAQQVTSPDRLYLDGLFYSSESDITTL